MVAWFFFSSYLNHSRFIHFHCCSNFSFAAFTFQHLQPPFGREGDLCTCVFRFGKVDKDVKIGFGLLFGSAVPNFEDDMETDVDRVRIKIRVPPRV